MPKPEALIRQPEAQTRDQIPKTKAQSPEPPDSHRCSNCPRVRKFIASVVASVVTSTR